MKDQSSFSSIKKPFSLVSLVMLIALVLVACAPAASSTTTPSDTIDVASNPTLGKILVNGQGMTLYIFTKDTPDQSNCDASCLANWPLLLTNGKPNLGTGIIVGGIGSATLSDTQ